MDFGGDRWVHVHELDLSGRASAADWALLRQAERTRALQIKDAVRRERFVIRRAALHRVRDGYSDDVFFSTSDSGDVGAIAVAPCRVGVDVEVETERRRMDRVAVRMFARDEQRMLAAVEGDARRRLFHRCWVAKEAYAKGTGRGLAMPFDGFSVAPALRSASGTGEVGAGWQVRVETSARRHLAVALEAA